MPELPEVETIKNDLYPFMVGQIFSNVLLIWPKLVRAPTPKEFPKGLLGQKIVDLVRRGKYIIFRLSSGDVLIIHLKMTGSLLLRPSTT
ncbi:MAG: formamidopyrimidine-DNA glycosylase, partial [Chloroflexi bacterium]|nr:formamidopyrimidine-DNA glycosylase [Chloroflexota bacterium]